MGGGWRRSGRALVEDVDAVFKRAVEAGTQEKMPVSDTFWGDRFGGLQEQRNLRIEEAEAASLRRASQDWLLGL